MCLQFDTKTQTWRVVIIKQLFATLTVVYQSIYAKSSLELRLSQQLDCKTKFRCKKSAMNENLFDIKHFITRIYIKVLIICVIKSSAAAFTPR